MAANTNTDVQMKEDVHPSPFLDIEDQSTVMGSDIFSADELASQISGVTNASRAYPSSGNVNIVASDPNVNCTFSADSMPSDAASKAVFPRPRCWMCAAMVLVVLGLALGFCWPKMPQWQVKELQVDAKDLNGMIKAFTDPSFNDTLSLPVRTVVEVTNNNVVGASTETGHLRVTKGGKVLAVVTTTPETLGARSTGETVANAVSTITPELSKDLIKEVMPDFMMKVNVDGKVPVKALGIFHFHATVSCIVDVNVLELVQNPNKLVTGHECRYGASF